MGFTTTSNNAHKRMEQSQREATVRDTANVSGPANRYRFTQKLENAPEEEEEEAPSALCDVCKKPTWDGKPGYCSENCKQAAGARAPSLQNPGSRMDAYERQPQQEEEEKLEEAPS